MPQLIDKNQAKEASKRHKTSEKIIFLNSQNAETLQGYKAIVSLQDGREGTIELHLTVTGFHACSAKAIFEALVAMNQKEIYSKRGD
jgi:hypothetical protein